MARPTKANSIYKVSIHTNGTYRYASTHPFTIDAEGKRKYKVLHWGTVTDKLEFIPGKEYLCASIEERSKLIFPSEWDMSAVEKLESNHGKGRPAYDGEDANRLYGDVWLLEQIAAKLGLTTDLNIAFGENKELVNNILAMSMFPYLTGFSYNRMARWQHIEKSPASTELTPTMITRITQAITEKNKMDLFNCRIKRLGKGAICAIDSTSRAAYGDSLADIKWGKSKDRLPLPQTTEVVAYSLDNHMPIYYRSFPGNIPDSRTVETILTDLKHAGFPDVVFVTDRGYESVQNLEKYILLGQSMIMCVSVHQKMILEKIDALGVIDSCPYGMALDLNTKIYHKQYDLVYKVKGNGETVHEADRMKLNLYFNTIHRAEDIQNLVVEIEKQRLALQAIKDNNESLDDDVTIKKNYNWFELEYDSSDRKLKSFVLKEKKVERAKKAAGFFANITLGLDFDSMKALDTYKLRDEQEKYFNQMKSQMNFDRQRNWSEDGKNGRSLILFVGLILSSYVRHIWKSTELHKMFSSSLEILDEMRSIRCIEHKGKARHITPFVGKQLDICKAFGINVPKGCDKGYKSKKVEEKRRGRPKKHTITQLES